MKKLLLSLLIFLSCQNTFAADDEEFFGHLRDTLNDQGHFPGDLCDYARSKKNEVLTFVREKVSQIPPQELKKYFYFAASYFYFAASYSLFTTLLPFLIEDEKRVAEIHWVNSILIPVLAYMKDLIDEQEMTDSEEDE